MHRRRFLRAGAAAVSLAALEHRLFAREGHSTPGAARIGSPEPFDYARLKGMARALAGAPYRELPHVLPPALARMSWDDWQSIRFREEKSLWAGDGLRFQVRFAHPGFTLNKPVRMYSVQDGSAQEIAFRPALFDYSRAHIRGEDLPQTVGFAGFKLLFHTDWTRDVAAFQGASYFRAVDRTRQFGMSQRGLAVNCGLPEPEEFPDFIAYYLERPAKDSSHITVYGLLDSPSVSGAYRFEMRVGESLTMDVDAALYPRKPIERLGIAPGTSMFLEGKNDRRTAEDWRPEVHDSDGLQLWTGTGEWIWRPLVNPPIERVNSYSDEHPRGFGLMQSERDFSQYQDDGVFYEKRPSVWVQPKGDWGKGAVMLVELPAADETYDNIVAFWTPAEKPQAGREYLYAYRLNWSQDNPVTSNLARVSATRTGIGGIIGQKRTHFSRRFVVDFVGGDLQLLGEKATVIPNISASRGRIEIESARPLREINGWRAMFDLAPTDDSVEPINLRLFLSVDGQALSETWLYQYTPPPPSQRTF